MPLLYKVETIWGTEALTEYWERVLRYYRQFYRQKAVANYRLMKWLHENAASLKKQPLENCFKDLEEDIKQGFIYKKHCARLSLNSWFEIYQRRLKNKTMKNRAFPGDNKIIQLDSMIILSEDTVPIWEKSNLTLKEAAAYSGVGVNKLRELSNDERCSFVLWVGGKRLIKRRLLDEFIEQTYSI